MFKKGHYYKGINFDGTTIIYKILDKMDTSIKMEIIIDNDKDENTHFKKGLVATMSTLTTGISRVNRWLTDPKEITSKSELIAIIL